MKRNLAGVAVAMLLVLGAVVPAMAQYSGPIKVTVPFNFVVENDRMPAGDYTIQRVATGRLRIESNDMHTAASFLAIPKQGKVTAEKAHFIFHRYGGEYFLATIWTPGQEVGWEVLQGKLETELARKGTSPVQTAMVVGH
ncbi:MAG: hypothetical protein WCB94_01655 [Terriglobales bacterium]